MVDKTQAPIVSPADRRWKFSRKRKEPDVAKEPKEQLTIEGAADQPSAKLKKAGKALTDAYYAWKDLGEQEKTARGVVKELMQNEGITLFRVNDRYEVELKTGDEKVSLKTLKEED